MQCEDDTLMMQSFNVAMLWWRLAAAATGSTVFPDAGSDEDVRFRAQTLERYQRWRTLVGSEDQTAAAAARKDIRTSRFVVGAQSWVKDRLHRAMNFVGNMIGAAMALDTRWARVPRAEFGSNIRETHFLLDSGVCVLNSCTVPCLSRPVAQARSEWAARAQLDSVQWRFKGMPVRLSQVIEKVCKKIGCRSSDTSIMTMYASAMSTVLRSLPWVPTDRILIVRHSHFTTHLFPIVDLICAESAIQAICVSVDLLSTTRRVAEVIAAAVRRYAPRLTILPHLLDDGLLIPLAGIAADCAAEGSMVMVDGSFSLGNFNFEVSSINADFFVAKLDCFCFCYPGTTVLVSNYSRHTAHCLTPLTVSYDYGAGYEQEWRYTGHSDHSTILCSVQALQFRKFICYDYQEYCGRLARQSVMYLCAAWHVTPFRMQQSAESSLIITVPLPRALGSSAYDAERLNAQLCYCGIFVDILRIPIAETDEVIMAARVTCNVFVVSNDIRRLAAVISAIAEN